MLVYLHAHVREGKTIPCCRYHGCSISVDCSLFSVLKLAYAPLFLTNTFISRKIVTFWPGWVILWDIEKVHSREGSDCQITSHAHIIEWERERIGKIWWNEFLPNFVVHVEPWVDHKISLIQQYCDPILEAYKLYKIVQVPRTQFVYNSKMVLTRVQHNDTCQMAEDEVHLI